MNAFAPLTSTVVVIPDRNINTDLIIPARFLTTTSKVGLGEHLFEDWRRNTDGSPRPDFPTNRPGADSAQVLLAGDNFGCGSSREHAPWALTDFGFRAVISTSFADIFHNNALKNGLLPLTVDAQTHLELMNSVGGDPTARVTVDLAKQILIYPGGRVEFPIEAFSKKCLLEGTDELGYLLRHGPEIAAYEQEHEELTLVRRDRI